MKIKTQAPIKVMYTTVKTTLKDIQQYVGTTPMDIKNECDQLGLKTNGIQYWVYTDASSDPTKEFTLEICLQVEGEAKSEKYQFQELPEFKCVTTIHEGSWGNFATTYEKFFGAIHGKGLQVTNKVREVYLKVDFENPDNNITEIQAGLA